MSRITPVSAKKRKLEEAMRGKTAKPRKRIKKQKSYHSSSEDEQEEGSFVPVSLADSEDETEVKPRQSELKKSKKHKPGKTDEKHKSRKSKPQVKEDEEVSQDSEDEEQDGPENLLGKDGPAPKENDDEDSGSSDEESGSDSDTQNTSSKPSSKTKSKRNDPTAFATSISKILSTKVPAKSADPVLAHSREAAQSRAAEASARLEAKATSRLRAEKAAAMEKGRIRDPSGADRGMAGKVAQEEKELRKIAQRGVVQLFNAFRVAHLKADEARREESKKGTIGIGERERKAVEMGKMGFLERIGAGKKLDTTVAK